MGTFLTGETTGIIFFVDSTATATKGDDANHGRTPQSPFATIDFAIGQCVANRGDIIKVLPGHAETITSAAGIAIDVAGVIIQGQGKGRSRPIITLASSTAASIDLLAANCRLENIVVDMTGIDNIGQGGNGAGGVRILAADCAVVGCELITATSGNQATCAIGVTTAAQRAHIIDNLIAGTNTAGPNYAIDIYGAGALTVQGIEIAWNRIIGDFAQVAINLAATDIFINAYIHDNSITNFNSTSDCIYINTGAGSSGIVFRNNLLGPTASGTFLAPSAGYASIDNYATDVDTAGILPVLVPVIGTQIPAAYSLVDQIIGEFSSKHANYLKVSADFSSATWNTVGTHELLVLAGPWRIIIVPVCLTDLTSGGAATIQLGDDVSSSALIGSTTATDIDANEFWLTTTPARRFARSSVIDVVHCANDIGYEIGTAALTGGQIDFHIWLVPLDASTSSYTVGAGGSL